MWNRNYELYSLLFHMILMLPQLSWSALSPIYRSNPTAIIIKITITNIPVNLNCKEHISHYHQRNISNINIPYHHHYHHHHHRIFKDVTKSKTVMTIFFTIFVVTVIIKITTIVATIININYYFFPVFIPSPSRV